MTTRPRGEVKIAGLFGEHVFGGELDGYHGAILVCCPDEARAIADMLYRVVELVPVEEVDAIRAERDQLRAERDTHKALHAGCVTLVDSMRAEVAQLRGALEYIAMAPHHEDCECDHGEPCTCLVHVAEDALRPARHDEEKKP